MRTFMKTSFVFLAVIILAGLSASGPAYAQVPPGEPGTYQLFQGAYPFINLKGELSWEKALFRINTATGEVWIGHSTQWVDPSIEKAKHFRGWEKFEHDLILTTAQIARR